MKKIQYAETTAFKKEFDRLCRRYRTLPEDIDTVKTNAIELFHVHGIDNQSVFPIPGFCSEEVMICKVKKFTCKALRGKGCNSGIRLIYAFFHKNDTVEFIEIYFKADKASEDKDRIKEYLKNRNR